MGYIFDPRFAESFIHRSRPHVVMGKRLLPFCMWHKMQLEWIDSKILLGGAGKWDIWMAALICQSQYPVRADVKQLGNLQTIAWHIRTLRVDPRKELEALFDYIEDFNAPPKTWEGAGSARKKLAEAYRDLFLVTKDPAHEYEWAKANHYAAIAEGSDRQIDDNLESIAFYCKETGCDPATAWNMPMGELGWMNVCFQKFSGAKVDIWTPTDEMRFEEHVKQRTIKLYERAKELEDNEGIDPSLSFLTAQVRYWQEVVEKSR